MKTKTVIIILLVAFILASCAPAAKVVSTETAVPTSTFTPIPVAPTITLTPIVYIDGLANIPKPDGNFIKQVVNENYLNVMGITREKVELTYTEQKSIDGQSFVIMLDKSTGIPRAMYTQSTGWENLDYSLRRLTDAKNIEFGSQVVYYMLTDGTYSKIVQGNFNLFTSSGELDFETWKLLKPDFTQTDPALRYGKYDLSRADKVIQFASDNNAKVQIYHLVDAAKEYNTRDYSDFLSQWIVEGNFSRDEYIAIMQNRIRQVMEHFKEKYPSVPITYVVVNETFDWNKLAGFWYDKIGADYIDIAFDTARGVNPNVKLLYNDVNVFYGGKIDDHDKAVYALVKRLKAKGVIDGVGFQMHLEASTAPSKELVMQYMKMYQDIGVNVYVTEFDVDMTTATGSPDEKAKLKAQIYQDMLEACLESGNCVNFAMFGFTPAVSWKPDADSHIYDKNYKPELAFYQVLKTLYNAQSRVR
jgi:endo-1,4-beta-xylanase